MKNNLMLLGLMLMISQSIFAQTVRIPSTPVEGNNETFTIPNSNTCLSNKIRKSVGSEIYLHYTCQSGYSDSPHFEASVRFLGRYPVGVGGFDEIAQGLSIEDHNTATCLSASKRLFSMNRDRYAFAISGDNGQRIFCYLNPVQNYER